MLFAYRYMPQEFQTTLRPESPMNPHFTPEKDLDRGIAFSSYLSDSKHSSPCESLLSHRVPSASLCLEDMLAQWPVTSPQQLHSAKRLSPTVTDRSSTATLVEFGDWIVEQSQNRPPSVLLPAPQLLRLPSSDTGKVECRLSSPTTPLAKETAPDRVASREQLHNLSAQLREVSVSTKSISSPSTREVTPVPSLTASIQSESSFGGPETSPCTTVCLPKDRFLSPPRALSSKQMARTKKAVADIGCNIHIRNISPPIPSPVRPQNERYGWANLPADPSRNSSYFPSRPVPQPDVNITESSLPRPSQEWKEISYMDWDDDDGAKHGDSALHRIKKSFTDLRAAERYISEANTRSKVEVAKATQESSGRISTEPPHDHNMGRDSPPTPKSKPHPVHGSIRLQPKHGAKHVSRCAHAHDDLVPCTPPSTGKRKRSVAATTGAAQHLPDQQKKKRRKAAVGDLVRRLLRAKK